MNKRTVDRIFVSIGMIATGLTIITNLPTVVKILTAQQHYPYLHIFYLLCPIFVGRYMDII